MKVKLPTGFKLFKIVLFVASLLILLMAFAPQAVRERIAINASEDSWIYNGSDIIWYSDNHSTETARIAGEDGDITTSGDVTAVDITASGDISAADITASGAFTVTGNLVVGSDENYALGYASAAQEVVCGEEAVTGTSQITPTGLSTVTYAIAVLAGDPGTDTDTGDDEPSLITIDPPSTQTLTINTWTYSGTVAAVEITVHWCAVGDQ